MLYICNSYSAVGSFVMYRGLLSNVGMFCLYNYMMSRDDVDLLLIFFILFIGRDGLLMYTV